jgi:hypothetical protein
MQKYSDFFQTLHDEQGPTGHLGHGAHYSILRAVVFHGPNGEPLPVGKNADFAVIWDEDHDARVIKPIEEIYRCGLLSAFLMFGECKGTFTALLHNDCQALSRHVTLHRKLDQMTQSLEDPWRAKVCALEKASSSLIEDDPAKVALYVKNLTMLWNLGVKSPGFEGLQFDPVFLTRIRDIRSKFSERAFNCLNNNNVIYLGDLVQKTEAEMLRTPNFGRLSLNEIKERLAEFGLHLGIEVPSPWPPKNIEALAERYAQLATSN